MKIARWLWRSSKGLRLQTIINAVMGVVSVGLDFAFILATKQVIDLATGHSADAPFRLAAILLVVIMCGQILLGFSRRWVAAILGVRSQNLMQLRLFRNLMQSEWNGIEQWHSGDVLNRLERDVNDVTNTITETIPSLLGVLVRLVGAFFFLYSMDARLACIMVCIAPVFIALSKIYVKKMRAITREIRTTDSQIQSVLQESVQHRVVLKTLERCGTMVERLDSVQHTLRRQIRWRTLFSSTSGMLLNIGFGTGYLVTFLWGANRLHEGTLTYGMMIAFIQLVGQIQGPFRELTRYIPILVGCLTASERLMELEQTPLEETGEPVFLRHSTGIRLTDVSYAYTQGKEVLHHFSCDCPPNSTTAILGETGAGKTTLVRLILALLRPQEGTIELYSQEEGNVPVSPLTRCNMVYVPQGNTLFSGTIRDNLLLGNPEADEEEMWAALKTSCADFVAQLPNGLDTRCGELGTGLSEGQAQRIAIARALLRKGNILLLDEATSALDPATEQRLLEQLNLNNSGGRTVICITHRPAVVDYCTQVIRF
ncbi:MAG: ABC transporter ATP-binding protein/permease [Bacteroidaceae bacterium]|nr:ABC transporter ATP-binding protein/permease [Bacteroidaceae bacterium]